MIQDLDEVERGPSRRMHVRVISVALIAAAFVGYAAAQSPTFQGPFATPRPSAAVHGNTLLILDQPSSYVHTWCTVPGVPSVVNAFSGDHPVTIVRQPPPPANPCSVVQLGLPIDMGRAAP